MYTRVAFNQFHLDCWSPCPSHPSFSLTHMQHCHFAGISGNVREFCRYEGKITEKAGKVQGICVVGYV